MPLFIVRTNSRNHLFDIAYGFALSRKDRNVSPTGLSGSVVSIRQRRSFNQQRSHGNGFYDNTFKQMRISHPEQAPDMSDIKQGM